ncbi:MAG: Crp/Fnr family transcriptional regulator [Nitrospiraceae bacterium]|nr:MAG: Crp/Fnr family transcriptional regulator [Nitrospiraceae bacterium]
MIMDDKSQMLEKVSQAFPFLKDADAEIRSQVMTHAFIARIPKGKVIFLEGDDCRHLALILSGTIRVYKPAESGREITLYRLGKGESCILTASCIFSSGKFSAIAITEEDAEAVMVPAQIFRDWMNRYSLWRDFIFNLLSKRLSEIIATIEEVTFRRMDVRIAEYLLKFSQSHQGDIRTTHQDIAMELGTSREVVSRILKHFEYEHVITLGRGIITIQDIKSLSRIAEQTVA